MLDKQDCQSVSPKSGCYRLARIVSFKSQPKTFRRGRKPSMKVCEERCSYHCRSMKYLPLGAATRNWALRVTYHPARELTIHREIWIWVWLSWSNFFLPIGRRFFLPSSIWVLWWRINRFTPVGVSQSPPREWEADNVPTLQAGDSSLRFVSLRYHTRSVWH